MNIHNLREELRAYYTPLRQDRIAESAVYLARRDAIFAAMDAYAAANPDTHPYLLKARLHEEIARRCEPVIFRHSPFFFELGVRPAENWGTPTGWAAASWMLVRREARVQQTERMRWIHHFRSGVEGQGNTITGS